MAWFVPFSRNLALLLLLACAGCAAEAFCTVGAVVSSPLLPRSLPCSGIKIPPQLARHPPLLSLRGAVLVQPPAVEDLSTSRVSPSNLIAFPGGGNDGLLTSFVPRRGVVYSMHISRFCHVQTSDISFEPDFYPGLFFWWQAGYVQSLQEQNPTLLEVRCLRCRQKNYQHFNGRVSCGKCVPFRIRNDACPACLQGR